MTTAHRPTFHPAVASANQGGYRYHAPRNQFSARDLTAHTKLKTRQVGQNAPEEIALRDLERELELKEQNNRDLHQLELKRQGLLAFKPGKDGLQGKHTTNGDSGGGNDPGGTDGGIDWSQFDDSDDEDEDTSDSDADSDDESSDDEAALMAEWAKIRAEKEAKQAAVAEQEAEDQSRADTEAAIASNPLLSTSQQQQEQPRAQLKRRWDDDLVFKNQSQNVVKARKRFINDSIRSDFHKKFLYRYVK